MSMLLISQLHVIHESVRKVRETCASFPVGAQTAKVKVTVCDKCLAEVGKKH